MSTSSITEPPRKTTAATDRLTEALEQKLSKARNERVAGIETRFSVVADQAAEEESASALVIG
jgi:hypothetical protein